MKLMLRFLLIFFFTNYSPNTYAAIKLPSLFQSNMVLQRDKPCSIWGMADNNEVVQLTFNNNTYQTIAKNGKWKISLAAQSAGGPFNIIIKGKNSIILSNVLFGDVWICSGQSNMQFSVKDSRPQPDTGSFNNKNIRLFTNSIGADFVPQDTLTGGVWRIATANDVKHFSAVGFFFGSYLQQHLNVPIGLISATLGATSIEEWMSNEAIHNFPQFDPFYNTYIAPRKSMKELNNNFEKIKPSWNKNYHLKDDPGLEQQWFLPETDISTWKSMNQPSHWEENELKDYDGSVWFRNTYDSFPKDFMGHTSISLGQVDDYNICWVNGTKIGEGYGNMNMYTYQIPDSIIKTKNNVVVVRVFDAGGKGGMYNMFWDPFLAGSWMYKKGVAINASGFKKPLVSNYYIFGTPTILYNGTIAPLTQLSIKGFIWYQGEANTGRAAEYRHLLQAMIKDWRKKFNQGHLPFLMVQLPNLGTESQEPQNSEWAELRDAQAAALELPNVELAVTIDIGESDDLHPHNKLSIGNRLALTALSKVYSVDSIEVSPRFKNMQIINDSIIINFDGNITCNDKYGYIRGFAIAGSDSIYHWAKASLINNHSVIVYNPKVKKPMNIRYLWSDEPGTVNLYNRNGLPVVPFRTDPFRLITADKTYTFQP